MISCLPDIKGENAYDWMMIAALTLVLVILPTTLIVKIKRENHPETRQNSTKVIIPSMSFVPAYWSDFVSKPSSVTKVCYYLVFVNISWNGKLIILFCCCVNTSFLFAGRIFCKNLLLGNDAYCWWHRAADTKERVPGHPDPGDEINRRKPDDASSSYGYQ